jgi:hypothetical protein
MDPVVFEQGERIGGQWSGDPNHSGVWPSMRTNTSRIMTSFSDLSHAVGSPTYPTNQKMCEYLEHYAELFDLTPRVRVKNAVKRLSRNSAGWSVETDKGAEEFKNVVIASGRYNKPMIPEVAGLDSFSGRAGVGHVFGYKRPEDFRGLRVLVAGSAISCLEIASDLAMLGAARVAVTSRKQRYVVPKLVAGVPLDHMAFHRFAGMADEAFPMEVVGENLKKFVLSVGGNPAQFGAPKPADNIFEANITLSQYFLPMVAEGRIAVKPWMDRVDHDDVHFTDGTTEPFDVILFGTGYDLHLPFLSDELRDTLKQDLHHIDLYKHTFHPELPGLAFLGLFEQVGPYYPVLELQARWIAYTLSGAQAAPSAEEMATGIAAYQSRRGGPQGLLLHQAALMFARAAAVEPELERWPELAGALMFGPLVPISFRMSGRDSLADAPKRFAAEVQEFGCMTASELTPMQMGQLKALAEARKDSAFSRFVQKACQPAASA